MATPQQPELHRSGLTPADPGSAKGHRQGEEHLTPGGGEGTGPVPEDNRPGHHPEVEQDKPVERFVEKARELAEEAHHHDEELAAQAEAGVPAATTVEADARHTGAEDLAAPEPGPPPPPPPPPGDRHGPNPLVAPALAAWALVRDTAAPLVAVPPLAAWDAVRQPDLAWMEIDESKTGWLARIVLVPFVGAWQYATSVRPRLEGAAVALRLRGG